jgi:hypothetical protein
LEENGEVATLAKLGKIDNPLQQRFPVNVEEAVVEIVNL